MAMLVRLQYMLKVLVSIKLLMLDMLVLMVLMLVLMVGASYHRHNSNHNKIMCEVLSVCNSPFL
jgi:hypothetical protein